MVFKVQVLLQAQREIDEAIAYYEEISPSIPKKFIEELSSTYHTLSKNPYYQKRYLNFRGLPLKRFPFILFFDLNETQQIIKIISCFHSSKNPTNYPKKLR
ncbi:MAG: hypothetical protein COZ75_09800 [Flavobacteriaceae bacterium CG_4_8_14_3_um_filter_34_10]|nr:type II toxin-antitoxin system RelE/ParE family toxin [Flavobacteriia bacterium]NCT16790.1 type II toxin-antitoxin system RelE/ParE family toxin [Flavobacteriia bacterium]PIV48415.1 MAG: hypothetical protein COS19_13930 [Flavobacteriaceae bacterium CG02_land_8_20_14_3_00_34_13]PIX08867.1 MAG: hypothetical protein COZ75_09800 [Flavobacteriaceae bacterium CG_4_8_14_3_um_filter_34_10]PIZ07155.1 MAG: hypothetical protein COY56_10450 [Flavobacteriaceae bacterium CG_4_10_14_0_8_um_filter_34_31]